MEWFSDLIFLSIANDQLVELQTINENIEIEHFEEVCGMFLFFRILINMWLLGYVRITVFYHSII